MVTMITNNHFIRLDSIVYIGDWMTTCICSIKSWTFLCYWIILTNDIDNSETTNVAKCDQKLCDDVGHVIRCK